MKPALARAPSVKLEKSMKDFGVINVATVAMEKNQKKANVNILYGKKKIFAISNCFICHDFKKIFKMSSIKDSS